MFKLVFLLTVLVCKSTHAETSLGKCTDIEPVSGFNMNRFLGLWYANQATDKSSPCLSYYFAADPQHEGQYQVTEIEQHGTIVPSQLFHEHNITGELTVPNPSKPGTMALDLPLDIGTTTFTVFMTDYNNYAAIYTCKKYPLMHSWSATILSRTRSLDMAFVDKIRTRLSSYNIDPFNLKIVSQKLCPKPGTKGSLVKTASNVVSGVRNTVSNVADNVEGTVKGLISDPNIKNTGKQTSFDVRFKDSTLSREASHVGATISNAANNFGETVSNAANNFGETVSGAVDDIELQANGVVNSMREGASQVVHNVGAKFNSITSQENVDAFGEKLSDIVSDVGEKINGASKHNE